MWRNESWNPCASAGIPALSWWRLCRGSNLQVIQSISGLPVSRSATSTLWLLILFQVTIKRMWAQRAEAISGKQMTRMRRMKKNRGKAYGVRKSLVWSPGAEQTGVCWGRQPSGMIVSRGRPGFVKQTGSRYQLCVLGRWELKAGHGPDSF